MHFGITENWKADEGLHTLYNNAGFISAVFFWRNSHQKRLFKYRFRSYRVVSVTSEMSVIFVDNFVYFFSLLFLILSLVTKSIVAT